VVWVGNSILQGVETPVDNILSDLAARHGLATETPYLSARSALEPAVVASSVRRERRRLPNFTKSAVGASQDLEPAMFDVFDFDLAGAVTEQLEKRLQSMPSTTRD